MGNLCCCCFKSHSEDGEAEAGERTRLLGTDYDNLPPLPSLYTPPGTPLTQSDDHGQGGESNANDGGGPAANSPEKKEGKALTSLQTAKSTPSGDSDGSGSTRCESGVPSEKDHGALLQLQDLPILQCSEINDMFFESKRQFDLYLRRYRDFRWSLACFRCRFSRQQPLDIRQCLTQRHNGRAAFPISYSVVDKNHLKLAYDDVHVNPGTTTSPHVMCQRQWMSKDTVDHLLSLSQLREQMNMLLERGPQILKKLQKVLRARERTEQRLLKLHPHLQPRPEPPSTLSQGDASTNTNTTPTLAQYRLLLLQKSWHNFKVMEDMGYYMENVVAQVRNIFEEFAPRETSRGVERSREE